MTVVNETFQPGYRLVDGSDVQKMADAINDAFGGVTPFASRLSVASGLTSSGTTRADALALTKDINVIGTAAASTGVVLPPSATVGVGGKVSVFNSGANAIKVYAAGSDTIDGTTGATGVTLTNAKRCDYIVDAAGAFISAQLGATSA